MGFAPPEFLTADVSMLGTSLVGRHDLLTSVKLLDSGCVIQIGSLKLIRI